MSPWPITALGDLWKALIGAGSVRADELPRLRENPALVPHYLPGKNLFLNEVTQRYNIPLEAVLGGPETMYQEYRKKLKAQIRAAAARSRRPGPGSDAAAVEQIVDRSSEPDAGLRLSVRQELAVGRP